MICALKDLQDGDEFIYQEEGPNRGKRRKVLKNLRGTLIVVDELNNLRGSICEGSSRYKNQLVLVLNKDQKIEELEWI